MQAHCHRSCKCAEWNTHEFVFDRFSRKLLGYLYFRSTAVSELASDGTLSHYGVRNLRVDSPMMLCHGACYWTLCSTICLLD